MSEPGLSRMQAWETRLAGFPRAIRMGICLLIALLSAMLGSQMLGLFLGADSLTEPQLASVSIYVALGIGLVVYIVGWWSLLGFEGEPHPQLGRRAVYYVMFGLLVTLMLAIWVLISVIIAMLPPEIPI